MSWCRSVWFDSRSSLIIIIIRCTFIYSLVFLSVPARLDNSRSVAFRGETVVREMALLIDLIAFVCVSFKSFDLGYVRAITLHLRAVCAAARAEMSCLRYASS